MQSIQQIALAWPRTQAHIVGIEKHKGDTDMADIKNYTVTCTSKYPAWDETPGTFEIAAKTTTDAIKEARKMMHRTGRDRHDGPVSYRAVRN